MKGVYHIFQEDFTRVPSNPYIHFLYNLRTQTRVFRCMLMSNLVGLLTLPPERVASWTPLIRKRRCVHKTFNRQLSGLLGVTEAMMLDQ